jgi:hypothetical protein
MKFCHIISLTFIAKKQQHFFHLKTHESTEKSGISAKTYQQKLC